LARFFGFGLCFYQNRSHSRALFTKVINTTSAPNPKNPTDSFGDLRVGIRRFSSPFAELVFCRTGLFNYKTPSASWGREQSTGSSTGSKPVAIAGYQAEGPKRWRGAGLSTWPTSAALSIGTSAWSANSRQRASRKTIYESFDYQTRNFTVAEPGVVLMTGRVVVHVISAGQKIVADLNFLSVWREEGGRWRFLAWQSCLNPPAKSK